MCEISSDEVFMAAGICGREVHEENSIRNWVHIQHSCYGDIPGVKCTPPQTLSAATGSDKLLPLFLHSVLDF